MVEYYIGKSVVVLCKADECVAFVKYQLLQSSPSQFSWSIFILFLQRGLRTNEQYANRCAFRLNVLWSHALSSTYILLYLYYVYTYRYIINTYMYSYLRENVLLHICAKENINQTNCLYNVQYYVQPVTFFTNKKYWTFTWIYILKHIF